MKIIVKLGTQSFINVDSNDYLDQEIINSIAQQVVNLKKNGIDIILISSGAVGIGQMISSNIRNYISDVLDRSLMASIGQPKLMQHYQEAFDKYDFLVSQLLLTKNDVISEFSIDFFKQMIKKSLDSNRIIPIINENDSISNSRFLDNDELTFEVAKILNVDKVIFLSSVNGVYDKKNGSIIKKINPLDIKKIEYYNGENFGTGGMLNKLKFAIELLNFGIESHICSPKVDQCIIKIIQNIEEIGTKICL